jgi:hypothetical protein
MRETRTQLSAEHLPRVHDAVVDLMNEPVGTVAAVFDDMFKVRTDDGLYYAPLDCVFKRTDGRVTLICNRTGIGRYFYDW